MLTSFIKVLSLIALISLLCETTEAQLSNTQQSWQTKKIPTVAFCELLQHPNLYARKEVRVRALYRSVFEESSFSSPNCTGDNFLAWVEFDNSVEYSTKADILKKFKKQMLRYGDEQWLIFNTELQVTGTLDNSETGYGHLGMYHFLFTVKSIEKVGKTKKIDLNKR